MGLPIGDKRSQSVNCLILFVLALPPFFLSWFFFFTLGVIWYMHWTTNSNGGVWRQCLILQMRSWKNGEWRCGKIVIISDFQLMTRIGHGLKLVQFWLSPDSYTSRHDFSLHEEWVYRFIVKNYLWFWCLCSEKSCSIGWILVTLWKRA